MPPILYAVTGRGKGIDLYIRGEDVKKDIYPTLIIKREKKQNETKIGIDDMLNVVKGLSIDLIPPKPGNQLSLKVTDIIKRGTIVHYVEQLSIPTNILSELKTNSKIDFVSPSTNPTSHFTGNFLKTTNYWCTGKIIKYGNAPDAPFWTYSSSGLQTITNFGEVISSEDAEADLDKVFNKISQYTGAQKGHIANILNEIQLKDSKDNGKLFRATFGSGTFTITATSLFNDVVDVSKNLFINYCSSINA